MSIGSANCSGENPCLVKTNVGSPLTLCNEITLHLEGNIIRQSKWMYRNGTDVNVNSCSEIDSCTTIQSPSNIRTNGLWGRCLHIRQVEEAMNGATLMYVVQPVDGNALSVQYTISVQSKYIGTYIYVCIYASTYTYVYR